MKAILFPFLLAITHVFSQNALNATKYNVQIDSTFLSEQESASFSSLLNNDIAAIHLVSILPRQHSDSIQFDSLSVAVGDIYTFESLFLKNDSVDFNRTKNRVTVDHSDVPKLMKALFSFSQSPRESSCYQPRHGIRFLDKKGQPLGFIEISLDCKDAKSTFSSQVIGNQKHFETIRALFEKYMDEELYAYDLR